MINQNTVKAIDCHGNLHGFNPFKPEINVCLQNGKYICSYGRDVLQKPNDITINLTLFSAVLDNYNTEKVYIFEPSGNVISAIARNVQINRICF